MIITVADSVELIQADHPGWRTWQGLNRAMQPSPTCWCATLRDRAVGVDPTVVAASAAQLRTALARQRERAERGDTPLDLFREDPRHD